MDLPVITGPSFPEDFEQPTHLERPLDDDGKPAVIDDTPTWAGENCDVDDVSADGFDFVAVPKLAASAGDTIAAIQSYTSEGEPTTQRVEFVLTAGGAAASGTASFGTAVKSTRRT